MPNVSAVAVRPGPGKESHLAATRAIAAGEKVLVERPLVSIPWADSYRFGSYCWELVNALLASPELLKRFTSLNLLVGGTIFDDNLDPQIETFLVSRYAKSRALVRRLYGAVQTNNIGQPAARYRIAGYALYPLMSRADHSCDPNASLVPGSPPEEEGVMLARRDIRPGEPITWSYLFEDDFLPHDFITRNLGLMNQYLFTCRCSRCVAERPTALPAGDLTPYLQRLLAEEALKAIADPAQRQRLEAASAMRVHAAANAGLLDGVGAEAWVQSQGR